MADASGQSSDSGSAPVDDDNGPPTSSTGAGAGESTGSAASSRAGATPEGATPQHGEPGSVPPSPAPPSSGPPAPSEPSETAAATELERLRAEVAALRGRLDVRESRRRGWSRARAIIAAVAVALAAFGVVGSVIGIWSARTVFDTDRWVATVAPLPKDPAVSAAVALYLTNELHSQLNLQQRVASSLPPQAAFLAAPVGDAVRNYLQQAIQKLLGTPQFQALWSDANRRAHPQLVAILRGRSDVLTAQGNTVTLNLLPIVNNALDAVDRQLPSVFGHKITLPQLTSGEIPPDLRQRIQSQLGVTLPADFAQITFHGQGTLAQVQDAVRVAQRTVVVTIVLTLLLLVLAFVVALKRRRTALQLGLWLAIATVVMGFVLRTASSHLLQNVPAGAYRDGAQAATRSIFTGLRDRGDQLFWLGIVIAVVAYLVGPGRGAVALRRYAVTGARWVATRTHALATGPQLRTWSHRYLDALRVAAVVVAAVVALAFSSWTALLVILILLVAFEVAVTLLARQGAELEAAEPTAAASSEAPAESEAPADRPEPAPPAPPAGGPPSS